MHHSLNSFPGIYEVKKIQFLMIVLSLAFSLVLAATTVYFSKIQKVKHIQVQRLTEEIKRRKLKISDMKKSTTPIRPTCWVEQKSGRGWAEIKLETSNPGIQECLEIAREFRRKDFLR